MKPPKSALVLVVVVALGYAATLLLTDGGVRGGTALPRLLVTERNLRTDDVVSHECPLDGVLRIDPGAMCRVRVAERFRTTRRVALRLDAGDGMRVFVQPADSRELPADRAVGAGEVVSDLTVSSGGGDVVIACDSAQPCVVAFA